MKQIYCVYCKDCKFNRSAVGVEFDTCKPHLGKLRKKTIFIDDYYAREHVIKTVEPELDTQWMRELNKENKCKFFQRKWWKFWIKEAK